MKKEKVALCNLTINAGTQPRQKIDYDYVAEMAEAIRAGAELPPVDVFFAGEKLILAHGFHRYFAHKQADELSIPAIIHKGSVEDAQWFSFASNRDQDTIGLRRTNHDKRRAVEAALRHTKGETTTNRALAEYLGVDEKLIRRCRGDMDSVAAKPQLNEPAKRTGIDGKSYKSNKQPSPTPEVTTREPADAPVQSNKTTEPPAQPPTVTDEIGHVAEHPHVKEALARRPDFRKLVTDLEQWYERANKLAAETDEAWLDRAGLRDKYRMLRAAIVDATPHAICYHCGGEGCATCKQSGYVSNFHFRTFAPKELQPK